MNPFPGMNPYLEEADLWRTVHTAMITLLFEEVNDRLPVGFRAAIDERITIEPLRQNFYPDVMVTQKLPTVQNVGNQRATALLDPRNNTKQHGIVSQPIRTVQRFLRIVTGEQWKQVVTVIELLSPTNKSRTGTGRRKYRTKQRQLMDGDCNLVEIDLLRQGIHTVAVPPELLQPYGTWDYIVSVFRFGMPDQYEYWLNRLPEPLPKITIPLLPEMEEIPIDLQPLLNRIYQKGRFGDAIDYIQSPPVLFSPEQEAWADALLRQKGLRT